MKKVLLSLAALTIGVAATAQDVIKWTEVVDAASITTESKWQEGELSLAVTANTDSKFAIDKNTAFFGLSADDLSLIEKYDYRLKTGGKSSSKSGLQISVETDGVLYVYVRTGSSSATDRSLVLTQNEVELFNSPIADDITAGKADIDADNLNKPIYIPVVVAVKAGDIKVEYPVGALNFYGIKFIKDGVVPEGYAYEAVTATPVNTIEANGEVVSVEYYNAVGVQVEVPVKGVNIVKTTYSNGAVKTTKTVK